MGAAYGTYAFLHARLGALKRELLSQVQWESLLTAEGFDEQRQVLEATTYGPWLRSTPRETLGSLGNAVYQLARKIERPAPTAAARFIHLWARRDLLKNLKLVLKGKALNLPEEEIRAELIELDPVYGLPVDALLRATSVDAALDLLERTALRRWIRAARRIYEKEPSLFGLDAALDRLYYPELLQQMRRLDGADQAGVRELIELELDQVNVLWLLRYRLNYRLSPAETYYLLVPVTGHVKPEQLKEMVREDTLEGVAGRVTAPWVRGLLHDCRTIWQAEVAFWRHRVGRARHVFRTAAFTLGGALALLLMKVAEVRDLLAILQGSELKPARRDIEEQLVSNMI